MIEFLLDGFDITGLETTRQETFSDQWMQNFYDSTSAIRKVKLGEIGERDTDKSFDASLLEEVQEAGDPAERVEISTAGRDNNIRTSTLIDALARTSTLRKVDGRDSEGELTKLNKSGRLTFSYPADLDHEGQAERMDDAVDRILRNNN